MTNGILTLSEYEARALQTDQTRKPGTSPDLPYLGLFGEIGSLTSEIKKKQRDTNSYIGYEETVVEELGDVLWYLTIIANRIGTSLTTIAGDLTPDSSFLGLQPQKALPLNHPTPEFERTLLQLGASTGSLLRSHLSGGAPAEVHEMLKNIFRALLTAANEAHVLLDTAAAFNLHKTSDRWPQKKEYPSLFDEAYPPEEQLPRNLTIEISERTVNGRTYVIQRCNGILIGDRVTDNIMSQDDYRFHDVFHYAYAGILGWSPVTRSLFRLKRRSNPLVDHAEDGARATLIEEGVSTLIFSHAKVLQYFAGQGPGDLSFTLLKTVRDFVRGFEPASCPLWLWEEAILKGHEAFRFLRETRKCALHLALQPTSRSFEFKHLTA